MKIAVITIGIIGVIGLMAVFGTYILQSLAYMKILKKLGYHTPILAWIPFANYYALGEVATEEETIDLFGTNLPSITLKLWWVVFFIAGIIPKIGGMLAYAVMIIFLGKTFGLIYAKCEDKDESECSILGYLSGWIPLIAVIKFLMYKNDED